MVVRPAPWTLCLQASVAWLLAPACIFPGQPLSRWLCSARCSGSTSLSGLRVPSRGGPPPFPPSDLAGSPLHKLGESLAGVVCRVLVVSMGQRFCPF